MIKGKQPSRKLALVIGNNEYAVDPLHSCVNNAKDITTKLNSVGFDVTNRWDLDYVEMLVLIEEFTKKITQQDLVVFYFSGHVIQREEHNYLLATDNRWLNDYPCLCENLAICVEKTVKRMEAKNPFALLYFLDCFRGTTDPWAETKVTEARENSIKCFLVESGKSSSIIIACDTNKRNSLFTNHLLQNIVKPNFKIRDIITRVSVALKQQIDYKLPINQSNNSPILDVCLNSNDTSYITNLQAGEPCSTRRNLVMTVENLTEYVIVSFKCNKKSARLTNRTQSVEHIEQDRSCVPSGSSELEIRVRSSLVIAGMQESRIEPEFVDGR